MRDTHRLFCLLLIGSGAWAACGQGQGEVEEASEAPEPAACW